MVAVLPIQRAHFVVVVGTIGLASLKRVTFSRNLNCAHGFGSERVLATMKLKAGLYKYVGLYRRWYGS